MDADEPPDASTPAHHRRRSVGLLEGHCASLCSAVMREDKAVRARAGRREARELPFAGRRRGVQGAVTATAAAHSDISSWDLVVGKKDWFRLGYWAPGLTKSNAKEKGLKREMGCKGDRVRRGNKKKL